MATRRVVPARWSNGSTRRRLTRKRLLPTMHFWLRFSRMPKTSSPKMPLLQARLNRSTYTWIQGQEQKICQTQSSLACISWKQSKMRSTVGDGSAQEEQNASTDISYLKGTSLAPKLKERRPRRTERRKRRTRRPLKSRSKKRGRRCQQMD